MWAQREPTVKWRDPSNNHGVVLLSYQKRVKSLFAVWISVWRFWWIPLGRIEAPLARLHAEDQHNVIIRDQLFDQDRSQKCRKSLVLTWFCYRTLRDQSQSSEIRWSRLFLVSRWSTKQARTRSKKVLQTCQTCCSWNTLWMPASCRATYNTRLNRRDAVPDVTCIYSDLCVSSGAL